VKGGKAGPACATPTEIRLRKAYGATGSA
jgi:hypothetical protein